MAQTRVNCIHATDAVDCNHAIVCEIQAHGEPIGTVCSIGGCEQCDKKEPIAGFVPLTISPKIYDFREIAIRNATVRPICEACEHHRGVVTDAGHLVVHCEECIPCQRNHFNITINGCPAGKFQGSDLGKTMADAVDLAVKRAEQAEAALEFNKEKCRRCDYRDGKMCMKAGQKVKAMYEAAACPIGKHTRAGQKPAANPPNAYEPPPSQPSAKLTGKVFLPGFFDRVAIVSLKRTPERLREFNEHLAGIDWPLREIEPLSAVDGTKAPPPSWWREGGPAWGCLNSHLRIIADALRDDIQRLLILEDDVGFVPDVRAKLGTFLAHVPDDWDCLMIGGQQMGDGFVRDVNEHVKWVSQCERTHCYALSRKGMESLYKWWSEPISGHCDWRLGDWQGQPGIRCYRPTHFLSYQRSNFSSIRYRQEPSRSWDGELKVATRTAPVVLLKAPADVVRKLRDECLIHTGYWRAGDDIDHGLHDLAAHGWPADGVRHWVNMVRDEAGAFPKAVCAVWHPGATEEVFKAAAADLEVKEIGSADEWK